MTAGLTGLDHIQLPVGDLAASVRWYERTLGFRLLTDYGTSAMLRGENGPDLMLWEAPGHEPVRLQVAGEAKPILFLKTSRIQEVAERFASEGVEVVSFDDGGFALFLKFLDPDGNFLGLIQLAE
ncbi:VOC family protein [Microbacterium sp. p3-SID336]|uniref:VOC family protein n=1 Tax=Microbacterium sp. p3-SID336 TaxID=2916212 RepID=UPI0021A65C5E|nr:VOC family protein [Microbacterium sp. p3-SID336]MCT1478966.1 VOC family protein [Microbacterium sp. p3-SID336]